MEQRFSLMCRIGTHWIAPEDYGVESEITSQDNCLAWCLETKEKGA
jgi:hypothetical protein